MRAAGEPEVVKTYANAAACLAASVPIFELRAYPAPSLDGPNVRFSTYLFQDPWPGDIVRMACLPWSDGGPVCGPANPSPEELDRRLDALAWAGAFIEAEIERIIEVHRMAARVAAEKPAEGPC